jgi:hypothetical protein
MPVQADLCPVKDKGVGTGSRQSDESLLVDRGAMTEVLLRRG